MVTRDYRRKRLNPPYRSSNLRWLKTVSCQHLDFDVALMISKYFPTIVKHIVITSGNTLGYHTTSQPRFKGLSSSRPIERARRDPGTRWSRAKHQGGVLCNQAIGRVELRRFQRIALCWDRHYQRWLIILSLQAGISNIIYSVCLGAIYRDHLMLLPSYLLYLGPWSQPYFNCGSRAAQFRTALIVVFPLNALDQIDAKNITMLLEKFIAFSK